MGIKQWKNWAGNQTAHTDVETPTTVSEICDVVRTAAAAGKRVRAAGGSYSWSPLIPTDGVIIQMHQFDKVLDIDIEANTIEVECGVSVEKLTKAAAEYDLTVVSPTLFPKPTIGGAISTGSHGTDFSQGGLADPIVEMTIITATGERKTINADGDGHDLSAAKVALGSLGIVYSVKLKLLEQYNVRTDIRRISRERVLREFQDLQDSCDFLEIFWFPLQDDMWVYRMTRTQTPVDKVTWWTRLSTSIQTTLENVSSKKLIPWMAKHMPRLTPILNKLASNMAFHAGVTVKTASEAFHFQHTYAKCWDLSYSLPAEEAGRGWADAIDLVEHYAKSKLYPVNLAVHGRFTGSSVAMIAPDHGRDSGYVEVTTAKGTPHWQGMFDELEERWCQIEGARPHWAKLYWNYDRIREQYPRMDDFLAVRERWDPDRVFLNPFLEEQVFQLEPVEDPG